MSSLDQLQKLEEEPEAKRFARSLPQNVTLHVVEEEVRPELSLIGCSVEEAPAQADKFLDRAFLSHLKAVRIIHGHGTGKLKAALSDFFRTHPHVLERRAEGGATVVLIRE